MYLKSGDEFSGCRILSRCGKGSFGVAYLAENPVGGRIVIKIVGAFGASSRELRGVRNYMQVSGTHPNLLQVFHVGDLPEGFYYTMEAADDCGRDGEYLPATLGNLMRQGRKFAPAEAVKITRELLAGIKVIHEAGLVHRDIKPDNIIFVKGRAKLSDPGLVIETGESATFAGSPGFIPPELFDGNRPQDSRSDLYAIGKVFYCMVTGSSPGKYPELPPDMPFEVCRQLFPTLSRVCNRDPAKRFRSADEFLASLPEELKAPRLWERFCSGLRDRRAPGAKRFRIFAGIVLLLFCAGLSAAAGLKLRRDAAERRDAACLAETAAFLNINRERPQLIGFQLQLCLPEKLPEYTRLRRKLDAAREHTDLPAAAESCRLLLKLLGNAAEKRLPVIPEKKGSFAEDFRSGGAARGFLSTPLWEYLPAERRQAYTRKLIAFERKLYMGWGGPRCDQDWDAPQDYHRPLVFVPPGAVKMSHNGKIVRIPYHFWICKNEASHAIFTWVLKIAPQYSPFPNTPLERASWNDILYFCFRQTLNMKNNGLLPPGYIVRPPTEAEWEYAAGNAWLGPDTSPLEERAVIKSNSGNRTHPSGSKRPSKLRLNDMYGNVAELCLPLEPTKMQNSVVYLGGSFKSTPAECYQRGEYLKYQFIPYTIGFRMVVGPGDMSYFDRHFFLSGPTQTKARGKVYELIGGNLSCFTFQKSLDLSRLLGGRLAEFEDLEHLDRVREAIPLAADGWGCFVGGRKIDGKWRWLSSGREITFGNWRRSRDDEGKEYLTLRFRRAWKPEKDFRAAIFLCEWDEKDFPRRNEQLESGKKLPGELTRFSVGDRRFMLIDSGMPWNAAYRFCELLGGRLACLETPGLRAAVVKKLEPFKNMSIMLGGYAKREKWYWVSGGEIEFGLKADITVAVPSVNRNFLTLRKGEFHNSQFGRAFLCEWPGHPEQTGPAPARGSTPSSAGPVPPRPVPGTRR
ncbi:MAG: SUMF1/EgtB/PvdO family nonheme iron enzyme [Lentisphaeria bacterium]|nr:SUMF1/EgtB/PvdO family nonheme iron enzyme [Lentisphaeria bacterium]